MKRGLTDFACPIAARTVKIALRHGGGLSEPDRVYVRCDQRDCQYVDLNEPPCPLRVELFSDESDERVRRYLGVRGGRLVCYACVTTTLGIDHDQVRRASWRLKDTPLFVIRPARCSECRSRRVTIGFVGNPDGATPRVTDDDGAARLASAGDGLADDPAPASVAPRGVADDAPPLREPGPVEDYLRQYPGYWLCAHCVARETRMDVADVRAVIHTIDRRDGFRMSTTQCVSCLLAKRVVRFDGTASDDDSSSRVLGMLFQNAGEAMCAACLAFATDAGLTEVKRLLGYLEALPEFARRMDTCTVCGRWQQVVACGAREGVEVERRAELGGMISGVVRHRGYRIELLSFRTAEGWRPLALVKTASRAIVPDVPAMLLSVMSTRAAADESAAAHARDWIDKRFPP